MPDSDDAIPKLKMAPAPSPELLKKQLERDRTNASRQREVELEQSLAPFRIGTVPYLNAAPLNRGLEDELIVAPPSQLGEMLRAGELDGALVSLTEALFYDGFDILDGVAVASLGEVKSVYLAHRQPLAEIERIHVDTATRASVELLRVLLGESGLSPELKPLESYADVPDNALLIGNPAIEFLRSEPDHEITDLGAWWYELTGLPFVYAVWALKRGEHTPELRRQLREAKDFGMDTLDHIIEHGTEFDLDFRKDYLGWHIHYHMGADEKKGVARFIELLQKHRPEKPIFEPVFV